MLKDYVEQFTNSELVDLVRNLKKNETNDTNLLEYSKNFRYLLNEIRAVKEITIKDYIVNLDNEIKNELVTRILEKKVIIY